MLDRQGHLIYVGKAKLLRNRLLSYFRKGSRNEKAGRIIGRTGTVIWEPAPSEFHALIRELELIRRWRPGFNVLGIPGSERYVYFCLGRQPAPYGSWTGSRPARNSPSSVPSKGPTWRKRPPAASMICSTCATAHSGRKCTSPTRVNCFRCWRGRLSAPRSGYVPWPVRRLYHALDLCAPRPPGAAILGRQ